VVSVNPAGEASSQVRPRKSYQPQAHYLSKPVRLDALEKCVHSIADFWLTTVKLSESMRDEEQIERSVGWVSIPRQNHHIRLRVQWMASTGRFATARWGLIARMSGLPHGPCRLLCGRQCPDEITLICTTGDKASR
jgi:hypothetical protein